VQKQKLNRPELICVAAIPMSLHYLLKGQAVENGKNGFVVPPKNNNELANAMLNIMQVNDNKINEMRAYSLAKIKNNYEIGIIIQKWLTLYQG